MTRSGKITDPFEERHTDYMIEWSAKADQVIATELNSLFDTDFSGNDVARKRAELKLPPPNEREVLAAVSITVRKQQEEERHAPKSQSLDAAHVPDDSRKKNGPGPIKNNFVVVSGEVSDKIDRLLAEKRENSNFTFKPVYVTEPKKGNVYIFPGVGPVRCGGIEKITIAGTDMKTVSFEEIYPASTKKTLRFSPDQIEKKGIREAAGPKILDDVLYKLAHGASDIKKVPQHATARKVYFDKILASPDLGDVTDLLCHTFGGKKKLKDLSSLDTTFGNLCIDLIAAEYAFVKNVPVADAREVVKRAVGKPTLDQLARYNDGKTYDDPSPA